MRTYYSRLFKHKPETNSIEIFQIRMRDTFMKVAQSLMVKKQLVNEKSIKVQLKDSLIYKL